MTNKFFVLVILLSVSVPAFGQSLENINPDSVPFAPAVNYPAGDGPTSVFCADLDGDGDLDLAVANWESDNVSILKNNGDGTFQGAVYYMTGDGPHSVLCADLNGDSDMDLAVANWWSKSVSVLLNNGYGTFQSALTFEAGDGAAYVFCADLDGDLDLDLVVANELSDSVSILSNSGDGTFNLDSNYASGDGPNSVFCADLDGDSDLDLAVANWRSDNISILKNNGNGIFEPPVNYGAGDAPYGIFCSDIDGDSDLDIVVADCSSNNIAILKNTGDGTFPTLVNYATGFSPFSVFCADLDGDSHLDLVQSNLGSNNISVLKNNGDGTFKTPINYGVGDYPRSVFCADLDGDSDLDLAVANMVSDNVSILLNLTNSRPNSYSLAFPTNSDSVKSPVILNWQNAIDIDPNDTIRYDLYLSRSIVFNPESTVVYDSLPDTTFTDSLESGFWHWKVKAYDRWGATRWSNQSWSFYVFKLGDVNADANIDLVDVIYLANYVLKAGSSPIPMASADVDCDGKYTLVDVIKLARYVLLGEPFSCWSPPEIMVNFGSCKTLQKATILDSIPPDKDCIEYQYDGENVFSIKHINAGFNCCADEIRAVVNIEDSIITIEEREYFSVGPCHCLCLFDLDYAIGGASPGEYTIRFIEPYLPEGDQALEFIIDFSSSTSGSHCVDRSAYPWGTW